MEDKIMTMVELRHKICEMGAARAEHPYGTPEFNAANDVHGEI